MASHTSTVGCLSVLAAISTEEKEQVKWFKWLKLWPVYRNFAIGWEKDMAKIRTLCVGIGAHPAAAAPENFNGNPKQ